MIYAIFFQNILQMIFATKAEYFTGKQWLSKMTVVLWHIYLCWRFNFYKSPQASFSALFTLKPIMPMPTYLWYIHLGMNTHNFNSQEPQLFVFMSSQACLPNSVCRNVLKYTFSISKHNAFTTLWMNNPNVINMKKALLSHRIDFHVLLTLTIEQYYL